MRFLTDTVNPPAAPEAADDSLAKVDTSGFRHFCKSMAKVQEILCWAVVENLLAKVDDAARQPLTDDLAVLRATVRELAQHLMLCSGTKGAMEEGYLDCQRVAAVVQLLGFLPHSKIAAALHTTHLNSANASSSPFASFAAFLLNLCDAVEVGEELTLRSITPA